MMIYQKLFGEYNQMAGQIPMTKNTMVNNANRKNAENTFNELLSMGVIPIVNENDSISTYELQSLEKFGDNDTLSAVVAALIGADLLILMSDIDGLFTDDPNTNPDAKFIDMVETLDDELLNMGKCSSGSKVGTGGMATKLTAARIATAAGTIMVIANGGDFIIFTALWRATLRYIVCWKEKGRVFPRSIILKIAVTVQYLHRHNCFKVLYKLKLHRTFSGGVYYGQHKNRQNQHPSP